MVSSIENDLNISIWPLDETLSLRISEPGSKGNEGVLCISQSFITEACYEMVLVSNPEHSLGEGSITSLLRCSERIV